MIKSSTKAGVVLCSGVGFDVIPTDCTALKLKEVLPDANQLSLGFESDSGISPGTSKTMINGLSSGSLERRDGVLTSFPLGQKRRKINFGRGVKSAMAIPWGDVSTAYYTTGIPTINTWIPMSSAKITGARSLRLLKPALRTSKVQSALKNWVDKNITGPDEASRNQSPAYIWGEAKNALGTVCTVRIKTSNVYSLTVDGALQTVERLLAKTEIQGGSYTPALLFGAQFIEELPGCGRFEVEIKS
ncbi:hypothetical protein [Jeotgalibacillus proteolyticus]|uniref:saccharopine dehydrogenase family protein n=1 Tax=Jeotgalibacillus proteolyticus TaxID=2082395 RepID=UPI00267E39DC